MNLIVYGPPPIIKLMSSLIENQRGNKCNPFFLFSICYCSSMPCFQQSCDGSVVKPYARCETTGDGAGTICGGLHYQCLKKALGASTMKWELVLIIRCLAADVLECLGFIILRA